MNDALPVVLPRPSPEALLGRIAAGDRRAFQMLYALTAPRLHGIALRLTRSAPLAEEIVQEVFLSVWRHAAGFDPARGAAGPWMARILRNRAADRLRRRRLPLLPLDAALDVAAAERTPEEVAALGAEARRVAEALGRLPPRLRSVIEMAYYEQADHREIAERTGAPVNTVKSWMRRALIRLRAELDRPEPP